MRRRHGARTRRRRHRQRAKRRLAVAGRRRRRERFACQPGQSREDAALRFALEISFARDAAVVLAAGIVEHDAGPVAGCEMRFADVGDVTGPLAAHPDALADDEAVGVGGEHNTLVWEKRDGVLLRVTETVTTEVHWNRCWEQSLTL